MYSFYKKHVHLLEEKNNFFEKEKKMITLATMRRPVGGGGLQLTRRKAVMSNSTHRYIPKRVESWHKCTFMNVHSSVTHNSHKVDSKHQISINRWMGKQNVIYPDNGTWFIQSTDTCHNVDKPWKCSAKCKKPDPKGRMWYDFVYMKSPEWVKSTEAECRPMVVRGWQEKRTGNNSLTGMRQRKSQHLEPWAVPQFGNTAW